MKIASIFLKKKLDKNTDHFLDNSQIHYLKKVLKLKEGELLHIYDGDGTRYLSNFNGKDSTKIIDIQTKQQNFTTTIAVPFLKKSQFEFLLQKCVEIGVKKIITYISNKSKSTFSLKKETLKKERYKEIIKAAFLQSENFFLPELELIQSLESLDISNYESVFILDQFAKSKISHDLECDLIISGGEFGFDEDERNYFDKNQATYINLGENILRAETAPLVALSKINF